MWHICINNIYNLYSNMSSSSFHLSCRVTDHVICSLCVFSSSLCPSLDSVVSCVQTLHAFFIPRAPAAHAPSPPPPPLLCGPQLLSSTRAQRQGEQRCFVLQRPQLCYSLSLESICAFKAGCQVTQSLSVCVCVCVCVQLVTHTHTCLLTSLPQG